MDKIDDELKGQIDEIKESSDGVADVFDKVIHFIRFRLYIFNIFQAQGVQCFLSRIQYIADGVGKNSCELNQKELNATIVSKCGCRGGKGSKGQKGQGQKGQGQNGQGQKGQGKKGQSQKGQGQGGQNDKEKPENPFGGNSTDSKPTGENPKGDKPKEEKPSNGKLNTARPNGGSQQ